MYKHRKYVTVSEGGVYCSVCISAVACVLFAALLNMLVCVCICVYAFSAVCVCVYRRINALATGYHCSSSIVLILSIFNDW